MALAGSLLGACQPAPSTAKPTGGIPSGSLGIAATPESPDEKTDPSITYISPGKVEIGNLYPNATGEFELTIYNGGDKPTTFSVTARAPDYTADGYNPLPDAYLKWVTFDDAKPVIPAKTARVVIVDITMPQNVTYTGQKAEFWVAVKDVGQGSMVQVELACRCRLSTR